MKATAPCRCHENHGPPKRIVITGGPGAGKTALLELMRVTFCSHVMVLPEAASLIFRGGFPRLSDLESRKAAQRAIFRVQRELEAVADAQNAAVVLCDRGTLDGAAYWPGTPDEYCRELGSTIEAEAARYAAVIHLRVPHASAYNHVNPLRTETAAEAAVIDEAILNVWTGHPHRHVVDSTAAFVDKAERALALVKDDMPPCCLRAAAKR